MTPTKARVEMANTFYNVGVKWNGVFGKTLLHVGAYCKKLKRII